MNDIVMWSPGTTLEALERQVIQRAFAHFKENKTATANSLGIAIRTLDSKLAKYDQQHTAQIDRDHEARMQREDFLMRCRGQHPSQQPQTIEPVAVKVAK